MAQKHIDKIIFEGNDTTDEAIIKLEMVIAEGDPVNIPIIEASVQNIRDLELFEWVRYRLDEDEHSKEVTLVIMLKERYYVIPLPTFKISGDNDLEYGVRFRLDNAWGLNHQLKWKIINKGKEQGIRQYENKIDYSMPRIFLSPYQLSLFLLDDKEVDEDPLFGNQLQRSQGAGFDVQRWLNDDGVSYGMFAGGGISYRTRDITTLNLPPVIGIDVHSATIYTLRIGTENIHDYEFNRDGVFLQYSAEFSGNERSPTSRSEFVRQEIDYIRLNSFSKNPPVNFNYRIVVGQSDNDILGDKAFAIGGNKVLRGYKTGEFRGNAMLRGNFEYLSKLGESPLLRKLFFVDAGAVGNRLVNIKREDFVSSAGVGLRWKIRQLVNVSLRLDVAYAFDKQDTHIGFGLSSTF